MLLKWLADSLSGFRLRSDQLLLELKVDEHRVEGHELFGELRAVFGFLFGSLRPPRRYRTKEVRAHSLCLGERNARRPQAGPFDVRVPWQAGHLRQMQERFDFGHEALVFYLPPRRDACPFPS